MIVHQKLFYNSAQTWDYLDSLNHSVNIDGLHRPLPMVGDTSVVVIPNGFQNKSAFDELGVLLGCNLECTIDSRDSSLDSSPQKLEK